MAYSKTVVVNLFAGPGAGKTTCAWEIASELKKRGYEVEYVPEYAKEFVWDNNLEMLDGSLNHQTKLYQEQLYRVTRLLGKVDFVVTDSPALLSAQYLKETNPDVREAFILTMLDDFKNMNNFNLFINRGKEYQQTGRKHNEAEAKAIDKEIKDFLKENKIYFGTYYHKTINVVIDNIIKNYEKLHLIKEPEEFLNLKNTIQDFIVREYGEENQADFSDLKKVDLAFITSEDEKHEIQVSANLIDLKLTTYVDGEVFDVIKYKSLNEMNMDIQNTTFDDLVAINSDLKKSEEKYYEKQVKRSIREEYSSTGEIIPNITEDDIYEIIKDYLKSVIIDNDINTDIIDFQIVGSRNKGTYKKESDIDVLVEYNNSDIREDSFFNLLNDENTGLEIDGITVDFNPINPERSGYTVSSWLEENYNYDKSKQTENEEEYLEK